MHVDLQRPIKQSVDCREVLSLLTVELIKSYILLSLSRPELFSASNLIDSADVDANDGK